MRVRACVRGVPADAPRADHRGQLATPCCACACPAVLVAMHAECVKLTSGHTYTCIFACGAGAGADAGDGSAIYCKFDSSDKKSATGPTQIVVQQDDGGFVACGNYAKCGANIALACISPELKDGTTAVVSLVWNGASTKVCRWLGYVVTASPALPPHVSCRLATGNSRCRSMLIDDD